MKVIKVSAGGLKKTNLLLWQSKDSRGVWNNCRFIINDNKLEKCDQIFKMDEGCIIDSGTFEYLLDNNDEFKKMSD